MKKEFKIENDGEWIVVSYQPHGPLETVLQIRCQIDNADCIAELVCATLNTLEATKQQTITQGKKCLCLSCRKNNICNPHINYGISAVKCNKYVKRSGTSAVA